MRLTFAILIFLITGCASNKRVSNYSMHHVGTKCQQEWKYYLQKNTIEGKIIANQKATAGCGYFITASTSVVITAKKDTLRIIELCNTEKGFSNGQSVIITPLKQHEFFAEILEQTPLDCNDFKTFYGIIDSIKK